MIWRRLFGIAWVFSIPILLSLLVWLHRRQSRRQSAQESRLASLLAASLDTVQRTDRVLTVWILTWPDLAVRAKLMALLPADWRTRFSEEGDLLDQIDPNRRV